MVFSPLRRCLYGSSSLGQFAPLVLALSSVAVALPADALPFDPLASSFQRWINDTRPGMPQLAIVVRELGRCVDHSQPSSPYRSPSYTCLRGEVALRQDLSRRCPLDRISYLPRQERLRLWPMRACASASVIPSSILVRGRVSLATTPMP
ncbi:MAG: hypothetical protein RLZZ624_53 [Cyanobacteriota bacterium]|jgi:hypothetical protein